MIDTEKMMGRAEQLKGKAEQVVGIATGSRETQVRGEVDEAKGKAREKVADVRIGVKKVASNTKRKVSGVKGDVEKVVSDATEKIAGINIPSMVVGIVGAVISIILLYRALMPSRRTTSETTGDK